MNATPSPFAAPVRPLRMMFVITSMPVGGAETLLVNLLDRLDRNRCRAEVACLKEAGPLGEQLATMLVLPADHLIDTAAQFQAAVRLGQKLIDEAPQRMVTFGIPPTYAAESFGYVERGAALPVGAGPQVFEVARFREKPDRATAAEYVAAGRYYWNAGIFMWRAETLLTALRRFEPEMAAHLDAIAQSAGTARFAGTFTERFTALRGKSIDYAVMERYAPVVVVEAPFSWDDVGSWQALARHGAADEQGNTARGNHLAIDSRGCIVQADPGHLVVTIGLEDLIVVQTPDATLVAPKHAEERIREVVQQLRERKLEQYL